jgi:hypothetical protein
LSGLRHGHHRHFVSEADIPVSIDSKSPIVYTP